MTIVELLREAQHFLEAYSSSPRLDAELLLATELDVDRSYLFSRPETPVSAAQQQNFLAALAARRQGAPLAYLLGYQGFWTLELEVGPGVLVPRPETELLIEQALLLPIKPDARVLDLGTGSGAIALALASERPAWQVDAVDVCAEALQFAARNRERYGCDNVQLVQSSWFDDLDATRYDLIVSNPPYIAEADPHLNGPGVASEPLLALCSGPDGLDAIRAIIRQARQFLRAGGYLLLEHGYDQADSIATLFTQSAFERLIQFSDLAGQPRLSGAQWPGGRDADHGIS